MAEKRKGLQGDILARTPLELVHTARETRTIGHNFRFHVRLEEKGPRKQQAKGGVVCKNGSTQSKSVVGRDPAYFYRSCQRLEFEDVSAGPKMGHHR